MDQTPELIAVNASAGSGKTYALAQRYVKLLFDNIHSGNPSPARDILALTFTNKAVAEMKSRVLFFLKKMALGLYDDERQRDEFVALSGTNLASSKAAAFRIIESITNDYKNFRVDTIDSFSKGLLEGCALKLNMSSGFQIRRDHEEFLSFALDEAIDDAQNNDAVRKLFVGFLHQYLFVEKKKGWFPKKNINSTILSMYYLKNSIGGSFVRFSGQEDFTGIKNELLEKIKAFAAAIPEGMNKTSVNGIHKVVDNDSAEFDVDRAAKAFKQKEIKMNKGYAAPSQSDALWDDIRGLIAKTFETEALSLFNPYIEMYQLVERNMIRAQQKEDVVFLPEIGGKTTCLFDGLDSVAEIYYRTSSRYRHFLLDEFQDTSFLQWGNLRPMIEETLSSGGSFYYVGDIKQAIYRFRGGDTSLFVSVRKQLAAIVETPVILNLSENYRSAKQIVEFNNEIFSKANLMRFLDAVCKRMEPVPLCDNCAFITDYFEHSKQGHVGDMTGCVKVELLSEDEGDTEDLVREKVLSAVKELSDKYALEGIAVLTRNNDQVAAVSQWLISNGYAVESEKTLSIRQCSIIKEIISLLTFLSNPVDDISFSSFITGRLFKQNAVLSEKEIRELIIDAVSSKEYVYIKFRQKYSQIWDKYFKYLFAKAGFIPVYEYLVSVIEIFSVLKTFPKQQAFVMKLLDIAASGTSEFDNLGDFVKYLMEARDDELYAQIKQSASIKVMTVHKAKGLEFDAVILPYFEMEAKIPARTSIAADNGQMLVKIRKERFGFSDLLDKIYTDEYLKSLSDELNNCYVALTRAKYEMLVLIPAKTGRSHNIARDLISAEHMDDDIPKVDLQKMISSSALTIPVPQYSTGNDLLIDEHIDTDELRNRAAKMSGEIYHYILSFIGNLDKQDRDQRLGVALERTLERFPGVDMFRYKEKIMRLITDNKLKHVFYNGTGSAETEIEVVDEMGRTKRIDRLITGDKEAIVIDFKNAHEKGDHMGQVVEYIELIRNAMPGFKVKGYLLYIEDEKLEEINASNA